MNKKIANYRFVVAFALLCTTLPGTVTDEMKEPLIGVTILVKGTTQGTTLMR